MSARSLEIVSGFLGKMRLYSRDFAKTHLATTPAALFTLKKFVNDFTDTKAGADVIYQLSKYFRAYSP